MTPPRLAERLLLRRLGADDHDELIGDLHEQFQARAASCGEAAARRWYWRQTLALLWGFHMRRRDVISRTHDRVRGRWAVGNLGLDLRYAWRGLGHSPFFSLIVLVLLTLGIGLSTTVYSLVRGILVDPLPYPRSDRLVRIWESSAGDRVSGSAEWAGVRSTSLFAWFSTPTAFSHVASFGSNESVITLPDGAANTVVATVSAQFFPTLGVGPVAGRVLQPSDAEGAAPPAAVISERLAWRSLGGPQAALGKAVGSDAQTCTIVGVLPATFAFPGREVDVWLMGREFRSLPAPGARGGGFGFRARVIARLKDDTSMADAQASAEHVAQVLAEAEAAAPGGNPAGPPRFRIVPLHDEVVAPIRPALLVLSGGMVIVLLAVIVTLTNLLLARHTSRQRELAVRLALGAGRWRVGRPVMIELLMLSCGGAAGGALLAWSVLRVLPAVAPADLPRIDGIHFDGGTMVFAIGVSVLTALMVGWLPLLQMSAVDVNELTPAGARVRIGRVRRTGDQLRGSLVIAQVAMAVMLLVGALLIGRSLTTLMNVRLGYDPDQVLTFQAAHPLAGSRQPGRLRTYYDDLLRRLTAHPAVRSAGTASVLPLHLIRTRSSVLVVGRPRPAQFTEDDMAVNQRISHDYLRTIATRVIAGRGFDDRDTPTSQPVALVDEVLARRFFPDGNAIGQQLVGRRNLTIVGIVEAVRIRALGDDPLPVIYYSAAQEPEFLAYFGAGVAVRTDGDPRALAPIVQQLARDVDPRVPLYNVRPLTDAISGHVAQPRFFTIVIGLFAALALSTAVLGIYGVLAYAVERRRLEFGIRRALGATESHVIALVVRRGLVLAGIGAALGLGAASFGAEFMRALLFGVAPGDPWSYGAAVALVLALAVLASWQPARRALRIDPARALRTD